MIDYLGVLRRETQRFSACLRRGDLAAPVPSCPGWTLADLAWHLAEVEHFWGSVAGDLLEDPAEVPELARPDDAALTELYADRSRRLLDAVARHPTDARCWSWYEDGWSVGWVRRRQSHEALIHRIDAELVVGDVTGVDRELAADGIDELLVTMVDGIPDWATFTPDGTGATLVVEDGPRYGFHFGRFVGTGPESGTDFDFETFVLDEPIGPEISGSAPALDVWLWGRGSEGVSCSEPAVLDRVRAVIAEATQ